MVIAVALVLLPRLISELLETWRNRAEGGGWYRPPGGRPFVVISGDFDAASVAIDLLIALAPEVRLRRSIACSPLC